MNRSGDLRLKVQRFEGLRAILIATDGRTISTIAARLPAGARQGREIRVPADEDGYPDWTRAALEPARI
jgi:hypothetical protein